MIKTSPYESSTNTNKQDDVSCFQAKIKNYLELSKKIFPLPDGQHRIEKDDLIQDINIIGGKKKWSRPADNQGWKSILSSALKIIFPRGQLKSGFSGNTLNFTVVDGSPIGAATETFKRSQIRCSFGFNR